MNNLFVLGIGAIEQHSHHLPVGTDWFIADYLARKTAEMLAADLLPTIPYSMSECHGPFPGTVWLKPQRLALTLQEIARKTQRLLIINGHCGNFVIYPVVGELNSDPDFHVCVADENWPMSDAHGPIFDDPGADLHAGEVETSIMLAIRPDLVRSHFVDFVPDVTREYLDYQTMDQLSPDGVWGRPSLAAPGKGQRALTEQIRRIVSFARAEFGENQ